MLDLSWVAPALAVGGRVLAGDAPLVAGLGIRRVVDLRAEDRDGDDLRAAGIALLHLPTPDMQAVPQEMLHEGVRWVAAARRRGEAVLVHCELGIGRSPLLACCVLVADGQDPVTALAAVKRARQIVAPNPPQLEALLIWARGWAVRERRPPPAATFDELAAVAYAATNPS